MKIIISIILLAASFTTFGQNTATAPAPVIAYGSNITLDNAKKVIAAAQSYAISKGFTIVVAIVDTGGNLVALEKHDNTQIASIEVAIGKAKTANNFKRSTKVFEDLIAAGGAGAKVLSIPAIPVEGGEPIFLDGKIIGAIGVSGMSSAQDGEIVKAALAAVKLQK